MAATEQLGIRQAPAIIPLRRLTIAQLVSLFGDFLAIFAIFSIVSFRLRGSPAQVSGVMIAYMLPQALAGPAAGVFADRRSVKRTMIASDLIRAGLVLFLVFQFAQIFTPGIAAVLTHWLGERSCFWLDRATFLMSAAIVSTLPIERGRAGSKELSSGLADLSEGVRFHFTHATLAFTILSMGAGLFAIRCYSALIAVYVRDVLHASTGLFGSLGTLVGAGMIAGTQVVSRFAKTRSREHLMMSGLFVVAAGILMPAIFGNVPLTIATTLALGVGVAMVVIPAQALMQGQTPMAMLGRVTSSVMSVLAFAQVCGLVLSGSTAQAIGIRNSCFATSALLGFDRGGGNHGCGTQAGFGGRSGELMNCGGMCA